MGHGMGFGAEHAEGKVVDQDTDCDYEDDEDLEDGCQYGEMNCNCEG